jgi:predicted O-linked N-acetylglucosamine transferase (SPINDLY family)
MSLLVSNNEWDEEAKAALNRNEYLAVIDLYEKKVTSTFCTLQDYFYLGLAYLLNEQEDLAQMIWFSAISDSGLPEIDANQILENILNQESEFLLKNEKLQKSWLVRRYISEINPSNIENLLKLILLCVQLENSLSQPLEELKAVQNLIKYCHPSKIDETYIEEFLDDLLKFQSYEIIDIIRILSEKIEDKQKYVNILLNDIQEIKPKHPEFAGKIAKFCLEFLPNDLLILHTVCWCYSVTSNYKEAIDSAYQYYLNCSSPIWKLLALYALIREKTRGGEWEKIDDFYLEYKLLIYTLSSDGFSEDNFLLKMAIPIIPCMLQYYQDDLIENRYLQNKMSELFQAKIIDNFILNPKDINLNNREFSYHFQSKIYDPEKKIRVGFLASKLSLHSVGWLSRWIFQYYNHDKFEFYVYIIKQAATDLFTETWFASKVEKCQYFNQSDFQKINAIIYNDEIDILVDLDSTTSCESCFILALKPSPIQVTWLGFDASGIPAIDYFIADPHLLPQDAENYYSERILRLPQTYLAIDGFEVDVPTISRQALSIPEDAVIYLSSQTGQKRNPTHVRSQLRVLKLVPNSYLIVKGWGEMSIIQNLFSNLAQEEGVDLERILFLPLDQNEFVHRANLQIADVILDTYPYNGATTTLEALWMGVPIVTRVGSQCAARNSYTFLANIGITDGIATTDEEYVNWGTRFGLEPDLRQKVSTQIRKSRHTSCLWDAKQFVQNMEAAFEKMWNTYLQSRSQ